MRVAQQPTARVIPEGGSEFEAGVTNLRPSSLFLRGAGALCFGDAVTVELAGLSLYGEVAIRARQPDGALVVFSASAEVVRQIEELMDEVEVIELGEPWSAPTPSSMLSDEDPTTTESLQVPAIAADTQEIAQFASAEPTAEIVVSEALRGGVKDRGPTEIVPLPTSKTEDLDDEG